MLTKNLLDKERERIYGLNADFNRFITGDSKKVGIIVNTHKCDHEKNVDILQKAGYTYEGKYPGRKGYELYSISIEQLEKVHNSK